MLYKLNGIGANIEIHIYLVVPSGLFTYLLTYYLLTYLLLTYWHYFFITFLLLTYLLITYLLITYLLLIYYLLTYLFTYYLLTPCSTVLLEKLTGSQLVKEFLALYGTRMFITAFTTADHLPLFWVGSMQFTSLSNFLKSHLNIIFPSTSGSSEWSLSLRFPHQNPALACLFSHTPVSLITNLEKMLNFPRKYLLYFPL